MRDALGPGTILGYCTNVHAGLDLAAIRANLLTHAVAVRERLGVAELGVGLWFPQPAARELRADGAVIELRDWLAEQGLMPFTLNGFPFGDFHGPTVKRRVYEPDWADPARDAYTRDLVAILEGLLPIGAEGSISTVPVGWGPACDEQRRGAAGERLLALACDLAEHEARTGRMIHIDLEPEPGCVATDSRSLVRFFETHLLGQGHDEAVQTHLRVCHDVCHAAVMFEPQATALRRYQTYGIKVGKIQISSGLRFVCDGSGRDALAPLAAFAEDRYLHQTVVQAGEETFFHEDLPEALAADPGRAAEWRVHFHVPVHLDRADQLDTTQSDIIACLAAARAEHEVRHFEVETYAWDVLPAEVRGACLADDIAAELEWVQELVS